LVTTFYRMIKSLFLFHELKIHYPFYRVFH
jgi:hypothetical protein